jgi:isocitrate dehydrogenase
LALYWAQALAAQNKDTTLKELFTTIAKELTENEEKINAELIGSQGKKQEIGGYYRPDFKLLEKAMRPSETLNKIVEKLN